MTGRFLAGIGGGALVTLISCWACGALKIPLGGGACRIGTTGGPDGATEVCDIFRAGKGGRGRDTVGGAWIGGAGGGGSTGGGALLAAFHSLACCCCLMAKLFGGGGRGIIGDRADPVCVLGVGLNKPI